MVSGTQKFNTISLSNLLVVYFIFLMVLLPDLKAQSKQVLKIQTNIKSSYYSDLFEISRYIKLETNSENLVSHIYSVKFRNDTVFAFTHKKVCMWEFSGKYIGSIGKLGNGPGEMIIPSDFALAPKGDKIGIWDNGHRCLFVYNLKGKFIEKVNPKLNEIINYSWTRSNKLMFNSQFITQNGKHFSLYLTDAKGNEINAFLPYSPVNENLSFLNYCHFPRSGEKQFAWIDFDQTIYSLENESLVPAVRYEFDRGNLSLTNLSDFKGDTKKIVEYMSANSIYQLFAFNQLANYSAFTYLNDKSKSTNFISIDGTKQYRIQHFPETLDPLGQIMPIFQHDNELVCIVEPYLLKTKMKQTLPQVKQKLGSMGKVLEKLANEIKEDDNPILLFLKLKE